MCLLYGGFPLIDNFMISGANGSITAYFDFIVRSIPYFAIVIVVLMLILSFVAWKTHQLTVGGSFGAFILGTSVILAFGFGGLFLYVFFLVLAAVLSKIEKSNRAALEAHQKQGKGNCRDIMQVFANGGLGFFIAILYLYQPSPILLLLFGASVAESVSDTVAGEVGMLLNGPVFSILNGLPVEKGLSGGVSRGGTLAGLIASFLIGLLWYPSFFVAGPHTLIYLLVVTFAGFGGCLADSIFGATIQVHYYDENEKLTEKSEKNGKKLEWARGIPFFDNDMVNLLSNAVAVFIAYILSAIFF